MTQNAVPDTSAGDPTPELTQSSLIKAVTLLNKYGFNIEVPNTGTAGPINVKRALNVSGSVTIPASSGMLLNVSQSVLRATILQQTVSTDDERTYLLNNASPPAGAFSNNMLYDKTGAGASFYMQRAGAHTFATAPVGTADQVAAFTSRVKIDLNGLAVLAGTVSIASTFTASTAFIAAASSGNLAAFAIGGVGTAGEYITGSITGDTAFRAAQGNLCLGAQTGNTTIGTSTKTFARFNTDGTVLIPGTNNASDLRGGFSVGMGVTTTVGTGNNVADYTKGFFTVRNVTTPAWAGGGMQLNAQNGLDFWTGDTTVTTWIRPLQLQTSGKVLIGGLQAVTAIGDLHVNQLGSDSGGSLSLTGLSGASYILMGNRDSLGPAGPGMIVCANRIVSIGSGTSYGDRAGGTYTPTITVNGPLGSVGIGLTDPQTYGPLAVNVTNGSSVPQVMLALNSPSTLGVAGTLASGVGIYWSNKFVGMRAVTGGDANNAGVAIMVAKGGTSNEGARIDLNGNMTVRGDTFFLGSTTTAVLSSSVSSDTYIRGNSVVLQSPSAVNYLVATPTLVTASIPFQANSHLTVGGVLTTGRQVEQTLDKVAGSGVVVYDFNTISTWVTTNPTGNFTPNFTNVPVTSGQIVTLTLIVQQGATGYIPNAVQINGTAVTVKWAGGMAPIATPNNIDVFVFSLVRTTSNTWVVLASATPYV